MQYLLDGEKSEVFNLGNSNGVSVRQVIKTAKHVTREGYQNYKARSPGDPPILVSSSNQAQTQLAWQLQYPNLQEIITHAWQWH